MDEPKAQETRGHMRASDWEDHLAAMVKGMRQDARRAMREFPTREFRGHMRAANREVLMAFRSILDKAIDRLEEQPEEPKASRIVIE